MGKNIANTTHTFFFCDGGSCQKAGSEKVVRAARAYLRNNGHWDTTHTIKTRCNGRCEDAPTAIVYPGGSWYKELTPEKITPIVKRHLNNTPLLDAELLYKKGWEEQASDNERPAFKPKPFEFILYSYICWKILKELYYLMQIKKVFSLKILFLWNIPKYTP